MMKASILKTSIAAAAIVATAIAVVPSYAADGPGRGGRGDHGDRTQAREEFLKNHMPSEHVEARLAYMKTALKITDAQSRLWNAVADVVRKHAKQRDAEVQAMMERRKNNDRPQLDLIQMLESRQQRTAAEAANQAELLTAAKPLLATLSDDQKREATALLMPHPGRGRGRM